jgi:hypothetical protein
MEVDALQEGIDSQFSGKSSIHKWQSGIKQRARKFIGISNQF